jgi:hypothetical protein
MAHLDGKGVRPGAQRRRAWRRMILIVATTMIVPLVLLDIRA